jgi:hypothetical protein
MLRVDVWLFPPKVKLETQDGRGKNRHSKFQEVLKIGANQKKGKHIF